MSRDAATLLDMLEACRSALDFLGTMNRAAFLADKKTRSAVLHQLLLLGEAAKRLSPGFRDRYPQIPWREIAGLRDRLIHAYDRVDLDMVWIVVQRRLPMMLKFLELQHTEPGEGESSGKSS